MDMDALDDARYRRHVSPSAGGRSSTPKGVSNYGTEEPPSDTEPDGPPFCVVEYDTAGRVVYTFPARYEGDTDEAG